MQKTLPKGHTSCLSSQFQYICATHTDLRKTFARIKQQLVVQSEDSRPKAAPGLRSRSYLRSLSSSS
jgi:hypothetical protein